MNNSLPAPAIFIRRPLGVLYLTGATRLDLIDRLSTQKVRELAPGQGAATVFTSEIGRMIDRVLLYAAEDAVIALTGENFGEPMARYLLSYVFFNDDFQLVDRSAETAIFALYGQAAAAALRQLGFESPADLPLHHWQQSQLNGADVTLHKTDPIGGDGYLLLVPAENGAELASALAEAGVQEIEDAAFEALRIAAGHPRLGREITGDYIPLEANLWDDVSFNKGCYVGQEIIARMESRGKLAKRLIPLTAGQPLTTGAEIRADGRTVGSITSAAGTQALGYVKTSALDKGAALEADGVQLQYQIPSN